MTPWTPEEEKAMERIVWAAERFGATPSIMRIAVLNIFAQEFKGVVPKLDDCDRRGDK